MKTRFAAVAGLFAVIPLAAVSAQTLARWTFDEGKEGVAFAELPAADSSGSGYSLGGWGKYGSTYSAMTASGMGLSARCENQDAHTSDAKLNNWAPAQWTIEISVRLDTLDGRNIIIGRDGSSEPERVLSDFIFENNDTDNAFVLSFYTAGRRRYEVRSDFIPNAGLWYHVALVSDGSVASMYVDRLEGEGYRLAGSVRMLGGTVADNALVSAGQDWSFGRGWHKGEPVYSIRGNLDDIRLTGRALKPWEFLHAPEFCQP